MSSKTTFVAPQPNKTMLRVMTAVNNTIITGGIPFLKHVYGFRPLTRITNIDFPDKDKDILKEHVGEGKAVFFAPNHPEFFTDWMIDKKVLSDVAPNAASWAAGHIVNAKGMQKFWLANNLIAQGTKTPDLARAHALSWAAKGNGVLLHPEGHVGWHGNYIDQLHPGIAEMAVATYNSQDSAQEVWIAPMVWKIMFTKDVYVGLMREYLYVCKRLKLNMQDVHNPAEAVFHAYAELLTSEWINWSAHPLSPESFKNRRTILVNLVTDYVSTIISECSGMTIQKIIREIQKWLIVNADAKSGQWNKMKQAKVTLEHMLKMGPFMWEHTTMTQEEVAEHFKRIRITYCKGTFKDTLHAFVPRPVGPRTVYIRAISALPVHTLYEEHGDNTVEAVTKQLRASMQTSLDDVVQHAHRQHDVVTYDNPFYVQ